MLPLWLVLYTSRYQYHTVYSKNRHQYWYEPISTAKNQKLTHLWQQWSATTTSGRPKLQGVYTDMDNQIG